MTIREAKAKETQVRFFVVSSLPILYPYVYCFFLSLFVTGNKRDDDDDEDNDDFDDALTSAETLPLSNDKKRKSDTASLKSSASGQANKYQAGGSGIHR